MQKEICFSASLNLSRICNPIQRPPFLDALTHHPPRKHFFGEKLVPPNSCLLGSFADFTRLAETTPVVLSGFPFLIIGFWQRGGGGGGRKIFIKRSSPDNEFSSPFECICGMPEWFITADSEVWQWAAEMTDGIFFLISFPWSSSSLGLCTSIN